jgi:hypothetical protein
MMKKVLKIFLYLSLVLLLSCDKLGLCKKEKLPFQRTDYNDSILKINGYYYGNLNSRNKVDIYWLYNNGVIYKGDDESLDDAMNGSLTSTVPHELVIKVGSTVNLMGKDINRREKIGLHF